MKSIIMLMTLTSVACGQTMDSDLSLPTGASTHLIPQMTLKDGSGNSLLPVRDSGLVAVANWHLFAQSRGGTISLLHGMTKEVCETAKGHALAQHSLVQTEQRKDAPTYTAGEWRVVQGSVGPGDIIRAECFQ